MSSSLFQLNKLNSRHEGFKQVVNQALRKGMTINEREGPFRNRSQE